ncbi:hypothetical protein EYR40_009271 [Pleurotus pulmonarius]|nr:hypothetical protein EYR40_009271 [Pleurotus pulmonarius]
MPLPTSMPPSRTPTAPRPVNAPPLFHFEYRGQVNSRFLESTKVLGVAILSLVVLAFATGTAAAYVLKA